jgi:glycosyltransferase involved in cell wall biosynthesis
MREWIPNWISRALSTAIPVAERTAARQFDAIIAVSDWISEPFREVAETVQTIHNFPATTSMPSVDETIETTADCTLCFVGGLVDVRGIHRMLDLLRQLVENGVDAELWALGSWMPDSDREAAEQFIEAHDLTDRVTFPGYLKYEEMFRYLESADVGLALYDVEFCKFAIPTKFFEYLYAGLPVVTTPVTAVSEFLPPEYQYVVPEGDIEGAAAAVRRALDTTHDKTTMRQIVEEQYSWEQEAKKLIDLYDELLD